MVQPLEPGDPGTKIIEPRHPIVSSDVGQGAWSDDPRRASPSRQLSPDEELTILEAHRRGEPDALSELLQAYQRRIYSVCYRMVRNEHEARDVTQDAIIKVLEGLDSYDGRAKLSTWIIRVVMNCCLSHLRRERLRRHGSLEGMPEEGIRPTRSDGSGLSGELSPIHHVEQDELRAAVLRALTTIDPEMRAVLVLRDMQDHDYQQIAEVLGVPIGTVKSRLFRARAALRTATEQLIQADSVTPDATPNSDP